MSNNEIDFSEIFTDYPKVYIGKNGICAVKLDSFTPAFICSKQLAMTYKHKN